MTSLYLVDASVYVFRAWFSIPEGVIDDSGRSANAVFGFGSFLCDLIERHGVRHVACAFDESLTTCFRNDLYPAYKANRPLPPPELERQFEVCRELARALGVATLSSPRFEADDLIGSCARLARVDGYRMVYVTADKDYAQLLEPGDHWWDAGRNRWLDVEGVTRHLGVRPDQVVDYLALAGDSIDNIPGVPGIGCKTAVALLTALDSLERIYDRLDAVLSLGLRGGSRIRGLLETHREQAWLSRQLSRIHCDAPLECTTAEFGWRGVRAEQLDVLSLPVQLRNRCRRLAEREAA
jgi:5'-3' exonuclease